MLWVRGDVVVSKKYQSASESGDFFNNFFYRPMEDF